MKYRKSQTGWITIFFFAPFLVFLFLSWVFQWGNNPVPFWMFLILEMLFIVITALFYRMTVEVYDGFVVIRYGIGTIQMRFNIDSIQNTETVKYPWYYGLGIRITPKGMLYNIHGLKAVRVEYTLGGKKKTIMIGSAEPEKLQSALLEAFPST